MPDRNKITFIICANDRAQCRDCISYLLRLYVPDNMQIKIAVIEDADGICSGYNRAMYSSDAALKVYLHQDTYILNRNFIADMKACFDRHPKAGMLGVIGRKDFKNRERFYQNEPFGSLYESGRRHVVKYDHYSGDSDERVLHLDGLLLMTCVDLPWREDLFDGWHLYDVSQSLEMIRAGYEVIVPYMREPWVLHDCGILSIADYDRQRDRAIREYPEFFASPQKTAYTEEEADSEITERKPNMKAELEMFSLQDDSLDAVNGGQNDICSVIGHSGEFDSLFLSGVNNLTITGGDGHDSLLITPEEHFSSIRTSD